jgi:hypothetical protein
MYVCVLTCSTRGPQKPLGPKATNIDKQRALLEVLINMNREVAEEFGFVGDAGYVKFQCNMHEYATDESISYNMAAGTMAVFRRAGINMGQP